MKIGEVIDKIKFEGRLTQKEIAALLECRQASVSRIKRNLQTPTLATVQKIVALAHKYKIKVKIEDIVTTKE